MGILKDSSFHKRQLERMEQTRLEKQKKAVRSPQQMSFSKQEGADYFVELCAAEETINSLMDENARLRKELDETKNSALFGTYRINTDWATVGAQAIQWLDTDAAQLQAAGATPTRNR